MNIDHLLGLLGRSAYAQEKALPENASGDGVIQQNLFRGYGGGVKVGWGELIA